MTKKVTSLSAPSSTAVVGVIGLGQIGAAVAESLGRAGHRVIGFDVAADTHLRASVVERAPTARAVAEEADTVLIAVYDDDQVRAVLVGADGILAAASLPATVCVLSTVTLATLRWASRAAEAAGVELIDCGVTGGAQLQASGTLVVLAGGSDAAIESARAVLQAFAEPLLHMGPLGAGMQAKLARNLMHYSGWYAAWEAARIASACDLDLEKLVEAHNLSNATGGGATALVAAGIGSGLKTPPPVGEAAAAQRRSAETARKDLGYALDLAGELGIPVPGAALVREYMSFVLGLRDVPLDAPLFDPASTLR